MRHAHLGDWGHPAPHGKLPPFRFWVQQTLPSLYDDSLSYLELCSRINWYIDQIINTLRVYDDKFCELMGLYKELEEYVRCYFDRADFPGMVKDILDDMAATGRLSEILVDYIQNYSFDPKKIKGGIVPVTYTYDHTANDIEYFKRDRDDEEVLEILRNGSVIMGYFKDSPTTGPFISFMKNAVWEYEGTVKEFECGCVNTVYTKDFTINYEDYMLTTTNYLTFIAARDHYGDDTVLETVAVYAEIEDGTVTHPKLAPDCVWANNIKDGEVGNAELADNSVTAAKIRDGEVGNAELADNSVTAAKIRDGEVGSAELADNSVTANKIRDGEVGNAELADGSVTHPKLGFEAVGAKNITNRAVTPYHTNHKAFIFIGDSYGAGYGSTTSWISRVGTLCGLAANTYQKGGDFYYSSAVTGSGFVGQSGVKTFLQQLQDVKATLDAVSNAHADQYNDDGVSLRDHITDIIVCGGWNDQGKQDATLKAAMVAFSEYVANNFPNATAHVGFIAGQDYQKRIDRGDSPSQFNYWEAVAQYARNAGEAGMAYIANSEYILHRWDYFQADGIHPNNDGQAQIAKYIASYVKGGGVDVVRGFEVVTNDVTMASGVTNEHASNWLCSTWMNNGRCGLWVNDNHWHFSTPVNFSGHPSDDSSGVGVKALFTLPDNSYVQGGQYSGMQVVVPATYKVSGANTYYTRPTYVRLRGKDVCICPISSNEGEGSNPYDPLENISDVIFQVATVRVEGETLFC